MKFAFRVDAASEIGLGHAMRCLALADAARKHGIACHFLSARMPEHLVDRMQSNGHVFTQLPRIPDPAPHELPHLAHAQWITGSQRQDAAACREVMAQHPVDWIILDQYALSEPWQNALRETGASMAVIDDLADRKFDADLLVDPNPIHAQTNAYAGLVSRRTQMCLGGDFAILRPEFANQRPASATAREQVDDQALNLLVIFGGTDPNNATGRVLSTLAELPDILCRFARVDVVMGLGSTHLEAVRAGVAQLDRKAQLHVDLRDVAGLMARSDICIGAGGGVAWERCCLGLPSLLFQLASNQSEILAYLEKTGAGIRLNDLGAATLKETLGMIDQNQLRQMSEAALRVVDGQGSDRIIARMLQGHKS